MKNPSIESPTRLLMIACLFLLILILVMTLPVSAAPRTNVIVTNTNDSGVGSLRDAIATASPGDTIVFGVTLPATITLSSELEITQSLTISGPSASLLAISGNNATRVISVTSGITLNLSAFRITNGNASNAGGGIYNASDFLTLTEVAVNGNTTTSFYGTGGGIYNSGKITIISSTISNNDTFYGGAIFNDGGTVNLSKSVFDGNFGIYPPGISSSGILNISDSSFSSNSGEYAGVIVNTGSAQITDSEFSFNSASFSPMISSSGALYILRSTFLNNTGGGVSAGGVTTITNGIFENNSGQGIANYGTMFVNGSTLSGNNAFTGFGMGDGGGINNTGSLTLTNITVYNNGAANGGGMNNTGTLMGINITVSGNHATSSGGNINNSSGTMTLLNTIVSNSTLGISCTGTITNGGNNIDDGTSCGWGSVSGSRSNTNPLLGMLASNGGSTQTMALLPGSPAIDGVTYNAPNGCPSNDQRGISRPQGARCDIGAFEGIYRFLFLPLIFR